MDKLQHSLSDRAWLDRFADRVKRRLSAHPKLLLMKTPCRKSDTGGWRVDVGRDRALRSTRLSLWFDQYFKRSVFWYGFSWSSRQDYLRSFGEWDGRVVARFLIGDRDVARRGPLYVLRRARRLGRPYLERYPAVPLYMFGQFGRRPATKGEELVLGQNIIKFAEEALTGAGDIDLNRIRRSFLKPRKVAALELEYIRRYAACVNRNQALARARKKKDEYCCQVCGFAFRNAYSDVARDFAESHHKEPLHKRPKHRKPRLTTLKDLITVCSNCHRMLHHRFDGAHNPVDLLTKSVQKSGFAKTVKRFNGAGRPERSPRH